MEHRTSWPHPSGFSYICISFHTNILSVVLCPLFGCGGMYIGLCRRIASSLCISFTSLCRYFHRISLEVMQRPFVVYYKFQESLYMALIKTASYLSVVPITLSECSSWVPSFPNPAFSLLETECSDGVSMLPRFPGQHRPLTPCCMCAVGRQHHVDKSGRNVTSYKTSDTLPKCVVHGEFCTDRIHLQGQVTPLYK